MRRIARLSIRLLSLVSRDRPVPLHRVKAIRRLSSDADALVMTPRHLRRSRRPKNPLLATRLAGVRLGEWSLGPQTIDLLEKIVKKVRPTLVLEFGSGISTVCIARFLDELGDDIVPRRVVSLDQSEEAIASTTRLLDEMDLHQRAHVVFAPLRTEEVDGDSMSVYGASVADVAMACGTRGADLVVVDGPAAEDGARYATLVGYRTCIATEAWVFLDDALRDGELMVGERWERRGYVYLDGIVLREKGVLLGRVGPSLHG